MLETPVSFAAHGNRLLISQGAVNIYIETEKLPSLIGSVGVAMMDGECDFLLAVDDEEFLIKYELLVELIHQATVAFRDPGLVH